MNKYHRSHWYHYGFITGIFVPLLIIFISALSLFIIEVKLDIDIPHRTITTTTLWMLVGFVSILILSRSFNPENLPGMREDKILILRKLFITFLSVAIIFGALARFGIDITGYIVGLGVGAIIIGLAAQSTISNFIAGVLVYIEKTINVGDYVRINIPTSPVEGKIYEISFFRTRIITNDQVNVSIPNNLLVNATVNNYTISQERPLIVSLNLATDMPPSVLKENLLKTMDKYVNSDSVSKVYFKGIQENRIDMELWIKLKTNEFQRERDRILRATQTACKDLNLTINALRTS
ncbi:MAG: mechanosensitive ion channel domain-containing protein [Candidatus Bathyarchaeia archaeon]